MTNEKPVETILTRQQQRANADAKRTEEARSETGTREPREHEVRIAQPLAPRGVNADPNAEVFNPFGKDKEKGFSGWVPDEIPNEEYTLQGSAGKNETPKAKGDK